MIIKADLTFVIDAKMKRVEKVRIPNAAADQKGWSEYAIPCTRMNPIHQRSGNRLGTGDSLYR